MKCEDCPLNKIPGGEYIKCVSDIHPPYCGAIKSNPKYASVIIEQSVARHERDAGEEKPGLGASVLRLGQALFKWGRSGFALVPEDVYKTRLALCESCDYFEPIERRCKKCTCYLDQNNKPAYIPYAKTAMSTERCPLDDPKWVEYEEKTIAIKNPPEGGSKSPCRPCGAKR